MGDFDYEQESWQEEINTPAMPSQKQQPMNIKYKLLTPTAHAPQKAHPTDAGADLTCDSWHYDEDSNQLVIGTGIAVEIPAGHVGLVFPRSSIAKTLCRLTNCVGVIDSDYRGEIMAKFDVPSIATLDRVYHPGERCLQLIIMPYPSVQYVEAHTLSTTERGEGGYGSTGQ